MPKKPKRKPGRPRKVIPRRRGPKPPKTLAEEHYLFRLGRRVGALRVDAKMSPEDLAKASGIDRSHIRRLERGATNPSALVIRSIAQALGVRTTEIYDIEE